MNEVIWENSVDGNEWVNMARPIQQQKNDKEMVNQPTQKKTKTQKSFWSEVKETAETILMLCVNVQLLVPY